MVRVILSIIIFFSASNSHHDGLPLPYFYSNPLLNSFTFEVKFFKKKKNNKKTATFKKKSKYHKKIATKKIKEKKHTQKEFTKSLPSLTINKKHDFLKSASKLLGLNISADEFLVYILKENGLGYIVEDSRTPIKTFYFYLQKKQLTFEEGAVRPGDFVFFHNTRDLNSDNKNNDFFTMVGVVKKVLKNGTIIFIGRGIEKIQELKLNLKYPKARRNEKTQSVLNSFIRPKRITDPEYTQYLAGELFAGFARIE